VEIPILPSTGGTLKQPNAPGARHYCGEAHAEVHISR